MRSAVAPRVLEIFVRLQVVLALCKNQSCRKPITACAIEQQNFRAAEGISGKTAAQ
jgi:hypothetical protein